MTDILGYEIETDEELQELLNEEQLVLISDYSEEELYEEVIDNLDSTQMADIIYQMMDEESFKDALVSMGMIEEFDGETYIDSAYIN